MTVPVEASGRVVLDPGTLASLIRAGLTARQSEIYLYIFEHTRVNGFQPSIRDIGARFGVGSPNGTMCHLRGLSAKGWVHQSGGSTNRSLVFLQGPDGKPFRGFSYPSPTGGPTP